MQQLLEKIRKLLPTIEGWCSFEKATELVKVIIERKCELCVEIGTFGGSSLIPQALALQFNGRGKIVGIDPWSKDAALESMVAEEHKKWWSTIDLQKILEGCRAHIATQRLESVVELVREKAENVVSRFADGSIDLLHIDGNHSEDLAYKDATLYLPKVKSGGLIFFDDVYWNEGGAEPTTRKAIVYLQEHCIKLDLVNDCMLLQKI